MIHCDLHAIYYATLIQKHNPYLLRKPEVCDTLEKVSNDVDLVFIADCNGDGSDHLKLATPSLKKGIPTFIDKPFADEVKDAIAIVRCAARRTVRRASM